MLEIHTMFGPIYLQFRSATELVATADRVTVYGAHYSLELTLKHADFGFIRESFEDLELIREDGVKASYPDRDHVVSVLIEAINNWTETGEGRQAVHQADAVNRECAALRAEIEVLTERLALLECGGGSDG